MIKSGFKALYKSNTESKPSHVCKSLVDHLHHLCSSPESHPFVRPFEALVSVLATVVKEKAVPFPVEGAIAYATKFLEPSLLPANRLAFAINAYTEQGMQQFIGEVGGALAVLAKSQDRKNPAPAVEHMLELWDGFVQMFSIRCQEVWELYVYFVFLDTKGERCLIKDVIKHLCTFLDCNLQGLSIALANTRSSAEDVLDGLAKKDFLPTLTKWHKFFIREWHGKWLSGPGQNGSPRSGEGDDFWEFWFTGRLKVPWSDFLDAFQASYVETAAPGDVCSQLRFLLDPGHGPHVSRAAWSQLSRESNNVKGIMEALISNIMEDLGKFIYRAEPLTPAFRTRTSEFGSVISRQDEDDENEDGKKSKKSKKSKASAYTEVSEELMTAAPSSQCQDVTEYSETPPNTLPGKQPVPVDGAAEKVSWGEYNKRLCAEQQQFHPWWLATGDELPPNYMDALEDLRAKALRMIQSDLICTDQALVLRIIAGDLAHGQVVIDSPKSKGKFSKLPSLVLFANSGYGKGVSTFGRGSVQEIPIVDHILPEPTISRSHFSINYDQYNHQFGLCDNGTKWGTYTQISSPTSLKCGDWISVGVAEFVVRYCGGECHRHKWHGQYRARSSIQRLRQYGWKRSQSMSMLPTDRSDEYDMDSTTMQGKDTQLKAELNLLLNSASRSTRWISSSMRLSQEETLREVPQRTFGEDEQTSDGPDLMGWMPIKPLEIEFVAGPRMGEKVVLWDRISTLGRSPSNTVQVHDPNFANVSRVHSIFQYMNNRWYISDNKSTNGTWRRLSCKLEPSEPVPLLGGEVIWAGNHEFKVEVVSTPKGCSQIPFVASKVLSELQSTPPTTPKGSPIPVAEQLSERLTERLSNSSQ